MLSRWLNEDTVQVAETAEDWQAALKVCAQPLLQQGVINQAYLLAIIASHQQLGPYYVLAPGLAMPHARPEDGAKALGLSLLKLRQGISFASAENDPVDLIILLSAPDRHRHIKLIAALAELFSDEEKMAQLHRSENKEEVLRIITTC